MSYRNYIAVVDKESLDKIRSLSYDEVIEKYGDEGYISEYTFEDKGIDKIREIYFDPTKDHLKYFITQCKNKVFEFSEKWFVSDNDNILHYTWQYEYDIFNLIYILKTFDWNKNYLLWVRG